MKAACGGLCGRRRKRSEWPTLNSTASPSPDPVPTTYLSVSPPRPPAVRDGGAAAATPHRCRATRTAGAGKPTTHRHHCHHHRRRHHRRRRCPAARPGAHHPRWARAAWVTARRPPARAAAARCPRWQRCVPGTAAATRWRWTRRRPRARPGPGGAAGSRWGSWGPCPRPRRPLGRRTPGWVGTRDCGGQHAQLVAGRRGGGGPRQGTAR